MKQAFCNAELDFSGRPEWPEILSLHHVSAADVGAYCVEVDFDAEGRSVTARILGDMAQDHPWAVPVTPAVSGGALSAIDTAPHPLWAAAFRKDGKSRLGGPLPPGLIVPQAAGLASGYGYVGSLSSADPAFAWLGRDIHLVWPFFADYHPPLFLDVCDPLRPIIRPDPLCALFDPETSGSRSPADEDCFCGIDESHEIKKLFTHAEATPVFAAAPFDMVRANRMGAIGEPDSMEYEAFVSAGVPVWVQYPEVPLDPGTGRPMRFVCQITYGPELRIISAGPAPMSPYAREFERMQFWGDGTLFVFASHDGRTLCLLAQNT